MTSEQLALQIERRPWDRALDVRIACISWAVARQVVEIHKKYGFSEMLPIERAITMQAKEDNDEL